ncbi:acyltransferase [Paraglaciecola sp. L1A13]|uniref:acyltransferase family protein n=1 Tax=Paraglaciecola sp. L1A13 TaxID=2686359 RepID=UPI00131D7C65|nr:acyltransferase [Paraglaciecola sp. L1A13]|tara:strand:+ start:8669 stop:9706 length:1038 start_codon:yes stop_codon:yes gene_type:complete
MRISFWDKWKGVAIIAVVLIHASGSTANFPVGTLNNNFGIILRQFINFPVGLFIFLAAFFVANSKSLSESYWNSVKTRVWRLGLPFLIWSFIYFGMRMARSNLIFADIPLMLLNGTSVSVGYFVIVMIQISIISPFLERLNVATLTKLLPLSLLVSICATYTLNVILTESIWSEFPYSALPFFIWLPFYIGGIIFGKKGEDFWLSIKVWQAFAAYLVFVCLSLAEAMLVFEDTRSLATSQLKVTSMLTTGTVCILIFSSWVYGKDKEGNLLSWIGQRSFYFYLSHMLILWKVKYFLDKFTVLYDNQVIFVLIVTFITLGITSIGALVLDILFSRYNYIRRALGLS